MIQCAAGLDTAIHGGSLSYELDTGIKRSSASNPQEAQDDINALHVNCNGLEIIGSPAATSLPTSPSDPPPPFVQDLTVLFFAHPDHVKQPVWFLDTTLPAAYGGEKDKPFPIDEPKPQDLKDGSIGIGSMKLTHPSVRHFGYQRKLKDSDDVTIDVSSLQDMKKNVNVQDCEFEVREDLLIPELYYWPESKRYGFHAKEGKEVVETPGRKVKDKVSLVCRDKDGNEVQAEFQN